MQAIQKIPHENMDYSLLGLEDLAWAAGFIDGEGTISFYRRSDRYREFFVKIQAVNTVLEPLQKLNAMFGGGVYPLGKGLGRDKPSFVWCASHQQAGKVIAALLPYLLVKRAQAQLALKARNLIGSRGKQRGAETMSELESLEAQFRLINKKGG